MRIGISTASLYPLHAEDAFMELANLGANTIEYFANSTLEAHDPVLAEVLTIQQENGIVVPSFHPFSSPMESVFLFSTYDRRIDEMMKMYCEFFGSMNRMGAKIFVLHGAILSSKCSEVHYLRQFRLLSQAGREHGITVAQENVCYCLSGKLEFLKMMKRELGDQAKFVLDLKQARRSGEDPLDYVDALGDSIVHCHVSDGDDCNDCLPVGRGSFDYAELLKRMAANGYDGSYIVELYRNNYDGFGELADSADQLKDIALSLGLKIDDQ